jgi:hypothetical protein
MAGSLLPQIPAECCGQRETDQSDNCDLAAENDALVEENIRLTEYVIRLKATLAVLDRRHRNLQAQIAYLKFKPGITRRLRTEPRSEA